VHSACHFCATVELSPYATAPCVYGGGRVMPGACSRRPTSSPPSSWGSTPQRLFRTADRRAVLLTSNTVAKAARATTSEWQRCAPLNSLLVRPDQDTLWIKPVCARPGSRRERETGICESMTSAAARNQPRSEKRTTRRRIWAATMQSK
jgi:hypothetical protein